MVNLKVVLEHQANLDLTLGSQTHLIVFVVLTSQGSL